MGQQGRVQGTIVESHHTGSYGRLEGHSIRRTFPGCENIVYEHLGKNQFAATGSGEIQYITPGTIDIFANAWIAAV